MIVSTKEQIHSEHQSDNNVTWEQFQDEYLTREDQFKYEWLNGEVEITDRTMNSQQFHIQVNMQEHLDSIQSQNQEKWYLVAEGDTFFDNHHRRPDIAFYTKQQIRIAKDGKNIVPAFVAEVISNKDQINLVNKKMQDYRNAKVKVVWLIFPLLKEVHIIRGRQAEIKLGDEICSADDIINGFNITVNQILA